MVHDWGRALDLALAASYLAGKRASVPVGLNDWLVVEETEKVGPFQVGAFGLAEEKEACHLEDYQLPEILGVVETEAEKACCQALERVAYHDQARRLLCWAIRTCLQQNGENLVRYLRPPCCPGVGNGGGGPPNGPPRPIDLSILPISIPIPKPAYLEVLEAFPLGNPGLSVLAVAEA